MNRKIVIINQIRFDLPSFRKYFPICTSRQIIGTKFKVYLIFNPKYHIAVMPRGIQKGLIRAPMMPRCGRYAWKKFQMGKGGGGGGWIILCSSVRRNCSGGSVHFRPIDVIADELSNLCFCDWINGTQIYFHWINVTENYFEWINGTENYFEWINGTENYFPINCLLSYLDSFR